VYLQVAAGLAEKFVRQKWHWFIQISSNSFQIFKTPERFTNRWTYTRTAWV